MELKLENHALVLVFLIIALVFIALVGGDLNKHSYLIGVIGILAAGYLLSMNTKSSHVSEHMEEPREITTDVATKDGKMLIDIDETALSPYGNIGTADNVDTLFQRKTDLDMTGVEKDDLDNSDLVQDLMQKGSSIFQPNTAQGTTASKAGYHSNFKLAEPGMYMEYSTPINPRGYNADEALSRAQQHRADINKRAIDGAVRSTRNIFEKYFFNELRETEMRDWWSAEASEFESDFRPYE
jgi:hypothetical protein